MRVVFIDHQEEREIGSVELIGGRAVPTTDAVRSLIESTNVISPNDFQPIPLERGADFIAALPLTFRGPYLVAEQR